jgi:hypothetical protein
MLVISEVINDNLSRAILGIITVMVVIFQVNGIKNYNKGNRILSILQNIIHYKTATCLMMMFTYKSLQQGCHKI